MKCGVECEFGKKVKVEETTPLVEIWQSKLEKQRETITDPQQSMQYNQFLIFLRETKRDDNKPSKKKMVQ